jgi:hypothetical protein
MPTILKRKYRYLYIAIACFVALVAIFVVDGYMGIYDTVYVTVREYTQEIEADYWLQEYSYYTPAPGEGDGVGVVYCCVSATAGENIHFSYEIDNHEFSTYSANTSASIWQQNEKITELLSEDISVPSFGEAVVEWQLSTEDLENTEFIGPTEQNQYAQCTLRINHGDVDRRIIIDFYYPGDELKVPVERY